MARRILESAWWAGFTFNGMAAYGNGHDSLIGGEELSDAERDQRLGELQGSPMRPGPLRVLRRGLLLSKPRTSMPWRWATSSPGTRAALAPSATCRRSASAAYRPATDTAKRAVCSARCIADAYPVSEGHSLVIPRRHGADGLELHQPEWNAVVELRKLRREQLSAQDASISGWAGLLNARGGLNSGEAGGQIVPCQSG